LPRDARSAGFTLVELMIVLAVLSLGAALALPYFAKGRERAALGGAAQTLRAALGNARAAAIAEDREVTFAGGLDGYRIDGARQGFAAAGVAVEIEGGSRLSFFPSGGSSGGRVVLRDGAARRDIEVEALTGRAVTSTLPD
jgi:general secretion pathway protein H